MGRLVAKSEPTRAPSPRTIISGASILCSLSDRLVASINRVMVGTRRELSTVVKIAPDLCVLFSKATVEIKDITSNTKRLIYIEQIQMHYLKQHIQTVLKTLPVYKKKTVQY